MLYRTEKGIARINTVRGSVDARMCLRQFIERPC